VLIISGILIGGTLNVLTTLGEELMWRGYLFEKCKHLGFWKSSSLIGVMWGLWHIPLIVLIGLNFPQNPIIGSVWMVIGTTLLSPIIQYLRIQGGSILLACIFHGILNKTAPLAYIFFSGSSPLIAGTTGIAGFIALAVINLILYKRYQHVALTSR